MERVGHVCGVRLATRTTDGSFYNGDTATRITFSNGETATRADITS